VPAHESNRHGHGGRHGRDSKETDNNYALTDAQALRLAASQGLAAGTHPITSSSGIAGGGGIMKETREQRYTRGIMIDYDKDVRSKRDGLYERQRLKEYATSGEDLHLLVTITCVACQHICMKLRMIPPMTFETLPKRRTDKSLVIDCPKYAFHVFIFDPFTSPLLLQYKDDN
jgi:hypothetical protein